jgi:hypothetical protein
MVRATNKMGKETGWIEKDGGKVTNQEMKRSAQRLDDEPSSR